MKKQYVNPSMVVAQVNTELPLATSPYSGKLNVRRLTDPYNMNKQVWQDEPVADEPNSSRRSVWDDNEEES